MEISKVCSFWILLAVPVFISAQVQLSGYVTAQPGGQPLAGIEVYDGNSGTIVKTDSSGYYQLNGLKTGTHRISVFGLAFHSETKTVKLDQNQILNFQLRPLGEQLAEVTVLDSSANSYGLHRLNEVEGTAIYAGKKNEVVQLDEKVVNLAAGNARQIYAEVAGLNIFESQYAGLQLHLGGRGLNPNRTSNFNTRQNGYDISADVLGYPESYYSPPAEALREIQIIRGAASLQYGTQFGGLINFRLKEPVKDDSLQIRSRQTLGSYGLYTSFNSASGTVGKWSYYTFYNFRRGDGFRPNAGFDSHNAYARLDYQHSDQTRFSFEYTFLDYRAQQPGGLTDSRFAEAPYSSNRSRNWFAVNWNLFSLKWEQRFSPKADLSLNLFGLDARRDALGFRGTPSSLNQNPITEIDEQDSDGHYLNPRDFIRNTFQNWGAELRYLQRYALANRRSVLLVGGKYYQSANTALQGPGSTGSGPDFSLANERFPDYPNQSNFEFPNLNYAAFAENIFYLSPEFSLTPGLRVEYIKTGSRGEYLQVNFDRAGNPIFRQRLEDNRDFSRAFVLLGLGASYKPSTSIEFYANFSQNYRSVTFNDIRVNNPTFVIDPDISDEEGFTADLGMRGNWGKHFAYDLTGFALLYDNRIGLILNDRAQRVRKNIGSALMTGLEAYGAWQLSNWLWGAESKKWSAGLFANLALTNARYLESEESNVAGKRVEFVPVVNFKTGMKVGYRQFKANLQYSYLSEQYTDVENSEVPSSGDLREGIIGPIPAYGVADLSLAYSLSRYSFEAGINNLFDKTYFTRRAVGYPGPGIIPAGPRTWYLTVGVKL